MAERERGGRIHRPRRCSDDQDRSDPLPGLPEAPPSERGGAVMATTGAKVSAEARGRALRRRLGAQHIGPCRGRSRCPGAGCGSAASGSGRGPAPSHRSRRSTPVQIDTASGRREQPSLGSVGDSDDTTLVNSTGLVDAKVRRWHSHEAVKRASRWVDRLNDRHRPSPSRTSHRERPRPPQHAASCQGLERYGGPISGSGDPTIWLRTGRLSSAAPRRRL
jgi:hypothetical protein